MICADFNHNLASNPLSIDVRNYFDLMVSYGFNSQNILNTYIAPSDLSLKSCLDHAWRNFHVVCENFVLIPSLSDHCPITVMFRKFIPIRLKRVVFRDYSSSNHEIFYQIWIENFPPSTLRWTKLTSTLTILLTS